MTDAGQPPFGERIETLFDRAECSGAYVVLCLHGRPYKLVSASDWLAATRFRCRPADEVEPQTSPSNARPSDRQVSLFDPGTS